MASVELSFEREYDSCSRGVFLELKVLAILVLIQGHNGVVVSIGILEATNAALAIQIQSGILTSWK